MLARPLPQLPALALLQPPRRGVCRCVKCPDIHFVPFKFEDVWWEPDGKQKLQVINGKRSAADLSAPPSSSKQLAPRTGRLWPHSFCTANLLQLPKMHNILGRPQGLAPGGQEWEEICEVLRDHAGVVSVSERERERALSFWHLRIASLENRNRVVGQTSRTHRG